MMRVAPEDSGIIRSFCGASRSCDRQTDVRL